MGLTALAPVIRPLGPDTPGLELPDALDVPRFASVGGDVPVTATGSAHNEEGRLRKNDPGVLRQLNHLQAKVVLFVDHDAGALVIADHGDPADHVGMAIEILGC